MAPKPVNDGRNKAYWGSALLVSGLLALLFNLASVAAAFVRLVAGFNNGAGALLSSVGLSLLHAVGSVALGQVDYVTLSVRVLVSFSAMVAMVLGIALIRSRSSKNVAAKRLPSSAARNGQEVR